MQAQIQQFGQRQQALQLPVRRPHRHRHHAHAALHMQQQGPVVAQRGSHDFHQVDARALFGSSAKALQVLQQRRVQCRQTGAAGVDLVAATVVERRRAGIAFKVEQTHQLGAAGRLCRLEHRWGHVRGLRGVGMRARFGGAPKGRRQQGVDWTRSAARASSITRISTERM
ncbi:MAG: hypothetical protein ABIN96_00935 [Rubrivivax sp.]